jgi:CheY-like chemotaxis protein
MAVVLVVDDNLDACRMMARLVGRCGHEAVSVTSGEEALAYLASHPVGLVILDNMMPGMDGMEVLRRVRDIPGAAGVPVVMWSAIDHPDFVEYALQRGATAYWLKGSVQYADLPQMLGRVLPGGCLPAGE